MRFGNYLEVPIENRAQLLDDAYNLAYVGIESWDLPRRLALYITRESADSFTSLVMAMDVLAEMSGQSNSDFDFVSLRDFLGQEFVTRYRTFGMTSNPGDSFILKMTKQEIVRSACLVVGDAGCVADAQAEFDAWRASPSPDCAVNPINPNLRYAVYCAVLRKGDQAEYDFVDAQRRTCYEPHERLHMDSGLNCSPVKEHVLRGLDGLLRADGAAGFELFEGTVKYNKPDGKRIAREWLDTHGSHLAKVKGKAFYQRCDELFRKAKE